MTRLIVDPNPVTLATLNTGQCFVQQPTDNPLYGYRVEEAGTEPFVKALAPMAPVGNLPMAGDLQVYLVVAA